MCEVSEIFGHDRCSRTGWIQWLIQGDKGSRTPEKRISVGPPPDFCATGAKLVLLPAGERVPTPEVSSTNPGSSPASSASYKTL